MRGREGWEGGREHEWMRERRVGGWEGKGVRRGIYVVGKMKNLSSA